MANPPQITWGNIASAIGLAFSMMGMLWVLMNAQLDSVEKRLDEYKKNSTNYLSKEEFRQHEHGLNERLRLIQDQFRVLESTRPTTGELQATAKAATETAERLEARVRALEQRNASGK